MSVATLNRLFQKLGPEIIQSLEYSHTGPPWSCTWRLLLPQGQGQGEALEGHGGPVGSKQQARDDAATKLMQSCMHSALILERLEKPIRKRQATLQADTESRASKRIKEDLKGTPLSIVNQLCQCNGWDPSWILNEEVKTGFKCTLRVDGIAVSDGCGDNIKAAKQSAAEAALALRGPVVSGGNLDPQLIESLCNAKFKQCMESAGLCHGELEIELLSKGTVLAGFLMVCIYSFYQTYGIQFFLTPSVNSHS